MNIVCLKWGDKFSHEHVNRLYHMCKKNMQDEFTFICYTENPESIDKSIKIIPLDLSYDLENWWWKLCLFQEQTDEVNIFFDLDVVIQKDITHYKDYVADNKITLVKCYWKPWLENTKAFVEDQFDMNINSSVMIWKGDLTEVWNTFNHDPEFFMLKYNGIDSYLYFDQPEKIRFLPKGQVYSRLYGIDENNHWNPKHGRKHDQHLFFDAEKNICLFNGWRRKTEWNGTRYLLDNEGYNGFEQYWD